MDVLNTLPIRFHLKGVFVNEGRQKEYVGGSEAMSYIDRDKVSLPEIVGHLRDHCRVLDGTCLYWLFPGADMADGLRLLVDDSACLFMSECIVEGGVADIYVEEPEVHHISDGSARQEESDYEAETEPEMAAESEEKLTVKRKRKTDSPEDIEKQIKLLNDFYGDTMKKGKSSSSSKKKDIMTGGTKKKLSDKGREVWDLTVVGTEQEKEEDSEEESTDEDYFPGDSEPSDEDEEEEHITRAFQEFKKKLKKGQVADLCDVVLDNSEAVGSRLLQVEGDGNETTYDSSSSDEGSDDMDSNGEVNRKGDHYPRFSKKDAVPKFAVGMKFTGKKQFKKAVIRYALAERKVINFVRDDPIRVRAVCDWAGCPWLCYLSPHSSSDSWQIATLVDMHTCPPRMDNKLVTARRIAKKYEKFIMANPSWSIMHMKTTVQEEMFAQVSIAKLKRAKAIVMKKAMDATKGQYQRLYDYQLELLRSNPGSTVIVNRVAETDPPVFQRMYICLDALEKGFMAGCRKVIGLDGCFFKEATNGELLCAIGRDANNQMYPIAWAVVDMETNESWDWFMALLCKDLQVGLGTDWVFISDQQKGLIAAVAKWAPEAEHRNCARHIYANWKKFFRNKDWQKRFWKCAKAPCLMLFNLARAKLARETNEGAQAILNTHPQHWSRAWFRLGSNCDSVDNNMCESFNKWIIESRFLPIITMLETIRRKVFVRIKENKEKAERWSTIICPNILKKLNVYITESAFCHAISNGADLFEVVHHENRFIVNLETKECSCRYWQLAGLPCPHAISCIFYKTNSLADYTASCYIVEQFRKTYSHCLLPVDGMKSWPVSTMPPLQAPGYVRMPGRPKKERRREATEPPKATKMSRVGTVIRCSKCKCVGHNRSTCQKISGGTSSGVQSAGPSQGQPSAGHDSAGRNSGTPNAMVAVSSTHHSSSSTRKRKCSFEMSEAGGSSQSKATKKAASTVKSTSKAKVNTSRGGSARINLHADVSHSQARSSASVQVTSGSAAAQVSAQGVVNNRSVKKAKTGPVLLLPSWESDRL